MDMKDAVILLIFLLSVLGLILGVHYTESSEPAPDLDNYDEVMHEDDNATITISLEKKENETSIIEKLLT